MNRIIIGVGGVGGGLVNEIARRIRGKSTLKEMEDKEFIAFDSYDDDLKKLKHIKEEYKIKLTVTERSVMKHCAPFLKDDYYRADGAGAGFQRIYGRALYLCNKSRITGAVESAARELNTRTRTNDFMIIIVNAFGGGTGSSMPMELAMDARAVVNSNYGKDPIMIGIGILPAEDEAGEHRANAFGAMKELHFILSTTEYNEISGKNYSNPYLMYLLLGRQGEGITRDKEIREALSHVLIDLGFVPVETLRPEKKWLDMADLASHARPSMNNFSTIGYYDARFPVDELLLYYDLKDQIPGYNEKIAEISDNLTDISGKIKARESELDELKEDLNTIKKSIDDMTEDYMLERKSRKLRDAEEYADAIVRTINDTRSEIEGLLKEQNDLERVLRETKRIVLQLDGSKNEIIRRLKSPDNTTTLHNVPISEEEVSFLEQFRGNLGDMSFRDIMRELKREDEYNRITGAMLPSILENSLINYRLTSEQYDPKVFEILNNAGFEFLSRVGDTIINRGDMLGNILIVISTDERNIIEAQLSEVDFISRIRGRVAKNMDVKRVEPKTGPHSFAIYSFLLGIHPWASSRGKLPQLRELMWTGNAYKNTSDAELEIRHSFMYGESEVFKQLTGAEIILKDADSRREAVTKFWKQYEIMDESVLWNQMPLTIAESVIRVEEIGKELERMNTKISSLTLPEAYKNPNAFTPALLMSLTGNLGSFGSDITKFEGGIKGFGDEFASLKEDISRMAAFVEGASVTGNEESMSNLVMQYNRYLRGIRNQLQMLAERYETNFGSYLKDAENFVSTIPTEKQTTRFIIDNIVEAQSEIVRLKEKWTKVKSDIQDFDIIIADLSETLDSMAHVIKSKV